MSRSEPPDFDVNGVEANHWWRKNHAVGALLNNLMFLFIAAPIALVMKKFYTLSFIVFAFMIPYGFLVRYLAVRAVRRHLWDNPQEREEFEQDRIISC